MAEPGERLDQEDDAERRIARARSAIGKSFEELIARGEAGTRPPPGPGAAPPLRPDPPPDVEGQAFEPRDPAPGPPGPRQESGNPDDIAASVERRVSTWVDGRVRAAERRLELQSEAFEAALGEEAVGSRRAAEQIEKVRKSLATAADQALAEVATAVNDARDELNAEVRERVDTALAQAEIRVRALGTAMQDEFRSSVADANRERVEDAVKAAAAGLQEASDRARVELRDDIANRLAEVSGEISAEVDSRVERRLGEAVKRVEAEGKRTVADATAASAAAAASEVEGRLPLLEERIDRGAGDQRAAIEARFSAAEATLRSRLGAAVDESATEQDRRMREEAAAHRKRINEELAAALQSTATELRRRLEADREGARREFSQAAREEISAAVERLDQLHSAAVRDAREAAEAVASARLAEAQAQIARQFETSSEDARSELDRGLAGVDSRLRQLFDELRGAQEAAGATREDEIRKRSESRIDELAAELSARVEREVARKLAEAQSNLERANADSAVRAREEARAGVEAAVNREVAKGEARIAAASKGVDLVVEERVAEGIAAVERRLQDQLASRQLEAQRILDRRFDALGAQLSDNLADEARESAATAATEARRRALDEISSDVAAAVEEARRGAREDLESAAREAAVGAVAAESGIGPATSSLAQPNRRSPSICRPSAGRSMRAATRTTAAVPRPPPPRSSPALWTPSSNEARRRRRRSPAAAKPSGSASPPSGLRSRCSCSVRSTRRGRIWRRGSPSCGPPPRTR